MQSATAPEDLHSILSRFSNWAGKHPTRPSKDIGEGVREVPYEEALRQLRDRRAASHYGTAALLATEERKTDPAAAPAPAQTAAPAQETAAPVVPQTPKAPAAKRPPAAAAKPAAKAAKSAPRSRKKPAAAATQPRPEFRQMLAKSISDPKQPLQKPAAQGQKPAGQDRELRLSFRVSREEEQELHRRADRAGVTVSAYLRQRALGPEPQEQPPLRTEAAPRHEPPLPPHANLLDDEPPAAGSWLSRIRQKFLAPPDWNESA